MTTARDVMTPKSDCLNENDTVLEAAKKLAELNVRVVPVCDEHGRAAGVLSEHDIVVKVVAQEKDPAQTIVRDVKQAEPVTVSADETIEEVANKMVENLTRRLAVVEGDTIVGTIGSPDIASYLSGDEASRFLDTLSGSLPGDDDTEDW